MSIATAIELFNHPILNPTKQLNSDNNNKNETDKTISNDERHQHAIFSIPDNTKQSEFNVSTSLWAHNERLLSALNNINNRILNGANININNSSFYKAIHVYLSTFNDTHRYDVSIGLAIMKLLYNVSDMFPHSILYIMNSKIPIIILKILKSGLKSYNSDEFSLHIEYINVLEYISRYSYQHSVVICANTDHFYLHDQDAQTAKQIITYFMSMTLDEENASGIIDCILSNISLHDRKDVTKALSILAQIFACCLCNNSSVPAYLKTDERTKQLDIIQESVKSLEERLNEMQQKAKDTLPQDALVPFQNKLNELKSQIDREFKRGNESTSLDYDSEDDEDEVGEDDDDEYDNNRNINNNNNDDGESNQSKRCKILKTLSNEVKMHCVYIVSILKHNFSEIAMVDNVLCFLCNFTQILLVHNAFDELVVIYSETFVKELMEFALRCYHMIIKCQIRAYSMNMDVDHDEDEDKNEFEIESDPEQPISDANNSKYCQFVVIVLRILYQILCIKHEDVMNEEDEEEDDKNAKWKQIECIQHHVMYSCHIERLYSDLVIMDKNMNHMHLNIIQINDASLLESIIVLGQTLNNNLQSDSRAKSDDNNSNNNDINTVADHKTMWNDLIHNLLCILVEYGRDIDSSSINLVLQSLNMILAENLLIMAQNKSNHEFLNGIYQQNNDKICELISFILEKNHETNHLNIVLLKHTLQILLDWYDFTKMLKQNTKVMEIKQNLKKYGADLMINHWKKLLKERYPNYSKTDDTNNANNHSYNKEIKQVQNVMRIIRKSRRILDLDEYSDSESDTESESESEDTDDDIDIKINKNNKKIKIFSMNDMNVMPDGTYFDYVTLDLDELLLSTDITTSDHLKKLGEMLLDMTRADNRICNKLLNGSMSTAENNRLFLKKSENKYHKYWRLYSLRIQSILKGRDMYAHFRILLSIRCLLNEKYLTKYQFIASGIIDILLYYLTVTHHDTTKAMKTSQRSSQRSKQKQMNGEKIKMDLLHDRQRLFAFVFFFDFDETYLQIHLCNPFMYTRIVKYKNKVNIKTKKKSESIKYLIHLLLQCLNMDVFPVRTIKTLHDNRAERTDPDEDDKDITMHNTNNNTCKSPKQFSFGAGTKSQQIDKYYYELKLLSERVLMINVCHDIDNCVVAQSLHFNYQHQLHTWEERQKVKREEQLKLEKQQQQKLQNINEGAEGEEEEEEDEDEGDIDIVFASTSVDHDPEDHSANDSLFKDRHKQQIHLPTHSSWGTLSSPMSTAFSSFHSDPAPYTPIRAVNFSVTGHLFMTVSDITKTFITKYEVLRKYKYRNPAQLLTDIAQNTIDKDAVDTIDLSSFLIHHCSNERILAQFLDDDNNNNDIASHRAAQLLQNGLELVVTYNGIELPKHLTVLQVLLTSDYPHLFNDHSSSIHDENSKTFEDITESRHLDGDEESEFMYRTSYSRRDQHVFNIYFRWKQQNRIKSTHSNKNKNSKQNDIKLVDLINPNRYLDNISHRSSTLLPAISQHTHKTRSASRRQTIASTNSLLLNSPPNSPDMNTRTVPVRRGKKRKFDTLEADVVIVPRKRRKIRHETLSNVTDYTSLYRDGTQTISISNCSHSNNSINTRNIECDLSEQHFPAIPHKWKESIQNVAIKRCIKSKWKEDGPTQIILKLLNYFHGFSSHWTSLYYDDFYDIDRVFDFNKPFDINRVKMKYVYNDRNNEDKDDIQCLLKAHIFYNKELIERLKNQLEQSIVVISRTLNDWIKEIAQKYPFLFPYHIRKDLFDLCSFGPSRTFKNLVQFLKKCHHNSDSVHSDNNIQRPSLSVHPFSHSQGLRQTNILNIPSMSPLFTQKQQRNEEHQDEDRTTNHTFSMIDSMLTNESCMIPKETHKTVKMSRKNVLSDICNKFTSSRYFAPLLSYYHFQTFRYHTSDAMPSDTFRDELALHLLPDPERISSIAISRSRYNHRFSRTIDFNETNHNSNTNSNNTSAIVRDDSSTPTLPKKKKAMVLKRGKTKRKNTNETQLQYLPIISEGVVEFNYDNDPFTTHFSESILRVQFYSDDGVGSGPTMEFFTLATNGLDRQDLQLWIDDDTHIESVHNNINTSGVDKDSDRLYAFGVYRCTDCTLINSILCCPHHADIPLSCYKNKNERGNIGIQSCVDELLFCDESNCSFHCHSDANFESLKNAQCTYCHHKCDIYFWVISSESMQHLWNSFPFSINCISHPLMQCDCCKMISFPQCHNNDNDLLMYGYGGVYDTEGRSYPIHYLSSPRCFPQHCNPFCYRSDINMIPILLNKAFVTALHEHIVVNKTMQCLDLNHYQNIICLSSGKSRKMRMSGTKVFLTGDEASRYKSKSCLVHFICSNVGAQKGEKEESKSKRKSGVIRNHMSHVKGYNGLFYRSNMLSFIRNSPLNGNIEKYLDVLGKIMILAIKENKRINLELHLLFFKMVLGARTHCDVSILDMLRIYPNDHYLMIFFRLFNIFLFYRQMTTYCACFREDGMDVEQEQDKEEQYTLKFISRLKRKCESFIDLLGLTMNTPTFNICLSRSTEEKEENNELNIDNLGAYLIGICDYFLNDGISKPNDYVQCGLQSMIVRDDDNEELLLPFYDYEFETLIIGSKTQHFNEWTPKYLRKYVKLEQYSSDAHVITNLYDVLCNEFDLKQKRQFIRFLTGSLSLPLGGLSKLNPQFTITKFANTEQQFLYENAEWESLPHATTCRHTLRLPPYKTKTTLKAKLLQAMTHAQTGFYLS